MADRQREWWLPGLGKEWAGCCLTDAGFEPGERKGSGDKWVIVGHSVRVFNATELSTQNG